MAKNVPIVFSKVSLRDLTSYEQIFKAFGYVFNRNKVVSKPEKEPLVYPNEVSVISDGLPRIDPDYARTKKKNCGFRSLSKALLTRSEREIKEMEERAYSEDVLRENPDTEENHW